MGLNTTHGAYDGAYSSFNRWRHEIARVAGYPPLSLMEGYYVEEGHYSSNIFTLLEIKMPDPNEMAMNGVRDLKQSLPIKWVVLKPNVITKLLLHSDCEGHITWRTCGKLADALEKLLPLFSKDDVGGHICDHYDKTKTFIDGCRLAFEKKEKLEFR